MTRAIGIMFRFIVACWLFTYLVLHLRI